jgi:hypothetical protein
VDELPPEVFLDAYPPAIRDVAEVLRRVVRRAVPDAIERVRIGWRLIGYEVPLGRKRRYFAYVAPEPEHVHLGFEYGAWVADPERRLEGAHLELKKVRYTTFRPGDPIPERALEALTHDAARVAAMSREERFAIALTTPEARPSRMLGRTEP